MAAQPMSGIYEIVNLVNGKRYIGSAINFETRWCEHRRTLRRGCHHNRNLQKSWHQYDEAAFAFRILEICDPEYLIEKEQAAIDALYPEFNISQRAGSTLGVKYTSEAKARVSASLRGKRTGIPRNRASVEKTAAAHRGMKRSAETRAKIAEKAKGRKCRPRSAEYRAKISAALKGRQKSSEHMTALQAGRARRVFTAEDRERLSLWLKTQYANGSRGRARPPEYREKIAASLRGRKLSAEHKTNVSKGLRAARKRDALGVQKDAQGVFAFDAEGVG